jgi:hypothetical protein
MPTATCQCHLNGLRGLHSLQFLHLWQSLAKLHCISQLGRYHGALPLMPSQVGSVNPVGCSCSHVDTFERQLAKPRGVSLVQGQFVAGSFPGTSWRGDFKQPLARRDSVCRQHQKKRCATTCCDVSRLAAGGKCRASAPHANRSRRYSFLAK